VQFAADTGPLVLLGARHRDPGGLDRRSGVVGDVRRDPEQEPHGPVAAAAQHPGSQVDHPPFAVAVAHPHGVGGEIVVAEPVARHLVGRMVEQVVGMHPGREVLEQHGLAGQPQPPRQTPVHIAQAAAAQVVDIGHRGGVGRVEQRRVPLEEGVHGVAASDRLEDHMIGERTRSGRLHHQTDEPPAPPVAQFDVNAQRLVGFQAAVDRGHEIVVALQGEQLVEGAPGDGGSP
jgi:hypothetical protein